MNLYSLIQPDTVCLVCRNISRNIYHEAIHISYMDMFHPDDPEEKKDDQTLFGLGDHDRLLSSALRAWAWARALARAQLCVTIWIEILQFSLINADSKGKLS